jgi:hypothetical protein
MIEIEIPSCCIKIYQAQQKSKHFSAKNNDSIPAVEPRQLPK